MYKLDNDHIFSLTNFDIIGLVETWHHKNELTLPKFLEDKYTPIVSLAKKNVSTGRASGGIILLIKKQLTKYMSIIEIDEKWIFIYLHSPSDRLLLGTVYWNPYLKSNDIINYFETFLLNNFSMILESKLVIGGDFNARIGDLCFLDECAVEGLKINWERKSLDGEISRRGRELMASMSRHDLVVLNGRTLSDTPAHPTFVSANGSSVIDLVWVNEDCLNTVEDLKVLDFSQYSWHFLISLNLSPSFELNKKYREYNNEVVKWNPNVSSEFKHYLDNSRNIYVNAHQTENLSKNFLDTLRLALRENGMLKSIKTNSLFRHNKDKPWFTENCKIAKKTTKNLYKICCKNKFDEKARGDYVRQRNIYNSMKKAALIEFETDLVRKFRNVKKPTDFWYAVNYCEKSVKSNYSNDISIEKWDQFYRSFYTIADEPKIIPISRHHDFFDADITLEELFNAISKLKNNKAPGYDKIPNEVLKSLTPAWYAYLLNLFNKILHSEKIPKDWLITIIKPLFKKGDPQDPNNYRAIALENTIFKLFVQILFERLYFWAENQNILPESQAGFRRGRGCLDHIFTLDALIEIHLQKNKYLFGIFVDFRKAFDYVSHSRLATKLYDLGVSAKFVRLIDEIYSNAYIKVNNDNQFTEPIRVTQGVLQGDPMSPLLFSLMIADFESYFLQNGCKGVKLGENNQVILLNFADDTMILASSTVDAQDKLNILEKYCEKNALHVNTDKTLVIPFHNGRAKKMKTLYYKNNPIALNKSAVYLGMPFSASRNPEVISEYFGNKANLASFKTIKILSKMKSDNWDAKIQLLNSFVKSVLLYSGEFWASRCLEEIEKTQTRYFKNLLHLPKNTPGYMIRLETGVLHLSYTVYKMMINYWIKLTQMENHRLPKLAFYQLLNQVETNSRTNWAFHLKTVLQIARKDHLLHVDDPNLIIGEREQLLKDLENHCRNIDIRRANTSSFNPDYILFSSLNTERYLTLSIPIEHIRVFAQLRLSGIHTTYLCTRSGILRTNGGTFCPACNLPESESLEHIIFNCDKYKSLRQNHDIESNSIIQISTQQNEKALKDIFNLIVQIIASRQTEL